MLVMRYLIMRSQDMLQGITGFIGVVLDGGVLDKERLALHLGRDSPVLGLEMLIGIGWKK